MNIDENSYKKYPYLLYWICDDKKPQLGNNGLNHLYLIMNKVNGYTDENK